MDKSDKEMLPIEDPTKNDSVVPEEPKKEKMKINWRSRRFVVLVSLLMTVIVLAVGNFIWSRLAKKDSVKFENSVIQEYVTPTQTIPEGTMLIATKSSSMGRIYRNEKLGFQIAVPVGWSVDDSGKSKAVVVIMNPKGDVIGGKVFTSYINVTTGLADGVTLTDKVNESRKGLQTSFDKYVIDEDKEILLSGRLNHLLGGTYNVGGVLIHNRNLLTIQNGRGYAVSITAPDVAWEKNLDALNESMFSFGLF